MTQTETFIPSLVLFDLDGTLLDKSHQVLPCSIEMLRELKENNIPTCITTGRCLNGTLKVLGQLPEELHMVTSIHNGAAILDGKEVLHEEGLSFSKVLEMVTLAKDFDMKCSVQTLHTTYVDEDPGPYRDILDSHDIDPIMLTSFKEVPEEEKVLKIAIFDLNKKLEAFCDAYQNSELKEQINLFQSGSYFADATSKLASKMHSGKWLAKHFDVSPNDVLAFGDQMNDSDMLSWAGKGVAMGNANPSLHSFADHITDCHNTGGISNFIRSHVLTGR